jgi:hypothetical protein
VSGGTSAGIIAGIGNQVIVRVPLEPSNEGRVRRNFEGLQKAAALLTGCPALRLPSALLMDKFHGMLFTVESQLPGVLLREFSPSSRASFESLMFELLLQIKVHTTSSELPLTYEQLWRESVINELARMVSHLPSPARSIGNALWEKVTSTVVPSLPIAFTHGDFSWRNIILNDGNRTVGLIDWDRWSSANFATHDFLHFLCHRRALRDSCTWAGALSDWLAQRKIDSQEAEWTRRFADELRLPNGWKPVVALAYWLRQVAGNDSLKYQLNDVWLKQHFSDIAPCMLRALESTVL